MLFVPASILKLAPQGILIQILSPVMSSLSGFVSTVSPTSWLGGTQAIRNSISFGIPGTIELHSLSATRSHFFTSTPLPSFNVCNSSILEFSNSSSNPLGQRTCTESIFVMLPMPK